jgi:hypothetical protein
MHPDIRSHVVIYRNEDFLSLAPLAGIVNIFDLANWHPTDMPNEEMGRLVFEALNKSYEYAKRKHDDGMAIRKNYDDWIRSTKKEFKYKTDRAMFTNMCSCLVSKKLSDIKIEILIHEKLKTWNGCLETKTVSANLNFMELGLEIRDSIGRAYAEEFA